MTILHSKRRNGTTKLSAVALVLLGVTSMTTPSRAFTGYITGYVDPACGASCCYRVPDMETSGDNLYGPGNWDWCRQDFLNNQADGWGMDKDDWDGGFGWEAACDMTKPFARTLAARVALQTAHPNPPSSTTDWSGPMLRWANGWAWGVVDPLGRVVLELAPRQSLATAATVRWMNESTVYHRWGNALWWVVAAGALASVTVAGLGRAATYNQSGDGL